MSKIGEYTEPRKADEKIQQLCNQVKDQVETKTGKEYKQFTAILYRTQVVAGKNFLIKVDVGDLNGLHLLLYRDLSDRVEVIKVEEHKKDDPLVPF
ncbi:leukocyte cysteine proteinase inhibitor 1-like [Poecilia formosa]|uniref:Cystatin-B n=1 Tax=Poecilia formosa TaxID=48698 RepID=A0A096MIL7_POEFO|nr:PREDICTED: leukocyte cysteine proteinase inhibitor 1-like [Poecilia formosa]